MELKSQVSHAHNVMHSRKLWSNCGDYSYFNIKVGSQVAISGQRQIMSMTTSISIQ